MMGSRGTLNFTRLFSVEEMRWGNPDGNPRSLVREFLKVGEAVAGRWIEMPHGILLLQLVPDRPDTGAIYVYDSSERMFYMLGFDAGPDDCLTISDFNQLLDEYNLLSILETPLLVQSCYLAAKATAPAATAPHPKRRRAAAPTQQDLIEGQTQVECPVPSVEVTRETIAASEPISTSSDIERPQEHAPIKISVLGRILSDLTALTPLEAPSQSVPPRRFTWFQRIGTA